MVSPISASLFTTLLLQWNEEFNDRQMPWKGEKDPYKIWVSEVILQQTRVEQGRDYYNRFIKAFPDVSTLANAEETLVFKYWEGLGYYTRCRNLIHAAKRIMTEFDGRFPDNYTAIKSLKGIGDYTSAAISSFAFELPFAVVDGNVSRVLSRIFGIETPVDTGQGKVVYAKLAQDLLDKVRPGIYNQAIMDFGATICKPRQPVCSLCPFQQVCIANNKGLIDYLPIKQKLPARRKRYFYYFLIKHAGKVYVQKRTGKDIWQNLYEFPLIETEKQTTAESIIQGETFNQIFSDVKPVITRELPLQTQLLTHQSITGNIFIVSIDKPLNQINNMFAVDEEALTALPFPKFINVHLQDKSVSLNLFQA